MISTLSAPLCLPWVFVDATRISIVCISALDNGFSLCFVLCEILDVGFKNGADSLETKYVLYYSEKNVFLYICLFLMVSHRN